MTISRRDLAVGTIALATTMLATRALHANPLGLPLGIQLYSVRTQMIEDFDAALAAVHAAGYSEVEAAALPKKPARDCAHEKPSQHLIAEVPRSSSKVGVTIGIDLGDAWSHYCTLNEDGEVVDRGRFRTSPSGIEKWFTDQPPARVAMEEGTHSI